MAQSLMCLLATGLGLTAVEHPDYDEEREFFDNILSLQGYECLQNVRSNVLM
jgi:hypothetical protein